MSSNYCVICGNEISEGNWVCSACIKQYGKESNIVYNVNHPTHYKTGKFECIDIMQEIYGKEDVKAFCLCNAFKYLYRAKHKENQKQDIDKAIWYLEKWNDLND